MKWQAFFKGEHISAEEFAGRVPTFTITGIKPIDMEEISATDPRDPDGDRIVKKTAKALVSLKGKETTRTWVLNRTNAQCLAAMWGDETSAWIGKRVTLYAEEVRVGREKAMGIRVKGSPDLTKPVTASIKLPRRRPFQMVMRPTEAEKSQSEVPAQDEPREELSEAAEALTP